MIAAKLPPQIVYAYEKTGLMLFAEDLSNCPPDRRKEWKDAIDEYFALQKFDAGKSKLN